MTIRPAALILAGLAAVASARGASEGAAARGEAVYARCAGCHAMGRNRTGPRHCGLLGRRAGSVEGFDYSEALRRSGIVWTPETLDAFLADPLGVVPGTRMGYAGVENARERADLVAYLVWASEHHPQCAGD